MKEIIICAAVEYKGQIWHGHRHNNAIMAMKDKLSYEMSRKDMELGMVMAKTERGFVTSEGVFVDRCTAMEIAIKAKQVREGIGTELFSEDLY